MNPSDIPAITTSQMIEVDRLMIEVYHIHLVQMMENAGRNLAVLASQLFLAGEPAGKKVLVMAGHGGNGGGGLVAARRLQNWGVDVTVVLGKPVERFEGEPGKHLEILNAMAVPVLGGEDLVTLPKADLILDALIGYSLRGAPRGVVARLINLANEHFMEGVPILSLDIPSGLNATIGRVYAPCIRATATITLALPKIGLMKESAKIHVGDLYLADISVPPGLYRHLGLNLPPIFEGKEILKI
jgi:NAD(P)H-hydrate epimerase